MVKAEQQVDEVASKAARRRRSVVLGLALAGFALMFYVLTIVKMGSGVFDRAL